MDDFSQIFDALPQCYLIISPEAPDFRILFANRAYLAVTRQGKDILGKSLFTIFPDNPDDPAATVVHNLNDSLNQVLSTRRPHMMDVQRYDTRPPGSDKFDIRYWKPQNIPVLDPEGKIRYIIHTVQDVTDMMLLRKNLQHQDASAQKQISEAVLTTQEMERVEISQELHDNINQLLNMSRLYLEYAMMAKPVNEDLLKQGHGLVKKAMGEVHKMSRALLDTSKEEIQLVEGLEDILNHLTSLTQVKVEKDIQLPDETLIESKMKLAVIRIVQEQLSNILKHSGARNLYIGLKFRDDQLHLSIKDDGKGFDMKQFQQGLGFQNIRSRAAMINGTVTIHSRPGDGCVIEVHSPARPVEGLS
ncbi:MAG: sensor histidine kinase [Flavisolibacter sp.]